MMATAKKPSTKSGATKKSAGGDKKRATEQDLQHGRSRAEHILIESD